ncbi:TetR/AcrR family transcriptional regulator [Nocardia sp. NBC_00511]|uniref:TetR/AcrR family transcriptional regulator n=1 Tax=Nocardia sp. NBC_00511 TaxID=2903591 RepID=UPI0030E002B1
MAATEDSRRRLVAGAADMIRRRGLAATSVRELAKHAHAPLGSTYHYFPGGKTQLAAEAVGYAGDTVTGMLERRLRQGPTEGLRAFLHTWRKILVDSDFRAGCPVLAVAVEDVPEAEGAPRAAAAAAFTAWTGLIASTLREHGVEQPAAESTAILIIAAFEGSLAMCRAERSTAALDRVAEQLERVLHATLETTDSEK